MLPIASEQVFDTLLGWPPASQLVEIPIPCGMAPPFGLSWADALADSRGNRLDQYESKRITSSDQHFIQTKCCTDVVRQVELALEGRNPRRADPLSGWNFRIDYDGVYTEAIRDALDLLKAVLTLRQRGLDGALALDFYKIPEDGVDPRQWADTRAGGLVHKGKYWGNSLAGTELADWIAATIRSHPGYMSADVVVRIPGTKHDFGERLAKGVAARLEIPCVSSKRMFVPTQQAKEGHVGTDLEPYEIDGNEVRGGKVLIVDDVYKSGISMRSVAKAAVDAGATSVLGIVGARTLSN